MLTCAPLLRGRLLPESRVGLCPVAQIVKGRAVHANLTSIKGRRVATWHQGRGAESRAK